MTRLRLRQLVIAAETLETADQLKDALDLGAPFHDPGVKEFGLENAVFAIGNQLPSEDSLAAFHWIASPSNAYPE